MKVLWPMLWRLCLTLEAVGKSLEDFKQGLTLSICVLDRAGSNVEYET